VANFVRVFNFLVMRKILVIENLEELLSAGLSFKKLAMYEKEAFRRKNKFKSFRFDSLQFTFKSYAESSNKTIYYTYVINLPF
jgi:hypothetical protein